MNTSLISPAVSHCSTPNPCPPMHPSTCSSMTRRARLLSASKDMSALLLNDEGKGIGKSQVQRLDWERTGSRIAAGLVTRGMEHVKECQFVVDNAWMERRSRTIQTGYLPDPQRHACSKMRSIPPWGHPLSPPFLTTLSVIHQWRSSLEGVDHCKNKPRTNMWPKTNVRVETTRYTSSRSLQNPGESNDSPLLKKTAPSHWKQPETSQKRLGELDAPQVRSYRTVNGMLHCSLQWERPKLAPLSHQCDVHHNMMQTHPTRGSPPEKAMISTPPLGSAWERYHASGVLVPN
jgi:hypothetical protein